MAARKHVGSRSGAAKGAETERHVLELRRDGLAFHEIGARLRISKEGARKAYERAIARAIAENADSAEALRRLELERCDRLERALVPKAVKGDAESARALLKVMERRSKLLGLDKPEEHNHNHNGLGDLFGGAFGDPDPGAGGGTTPPVSG